VCYAFLGRRLAHQIVVSVFFFIFDFISDFIFDNIFDNIFIFRANDKSFLIAHEGSLDLGEIVLLIDA